MCSTYVSERISVGQRVLVYISKNPDFRLPADRQRPILMVGPGTGLAPFRAFNKHRLLEEGKGTEGADATAATAAIPHGGEMVLYFGCRRSDQDYLYGAQLEAWGGSGALTLLTAFSRQQAQKVRPVPCPRNCHCFDHHARCCSFSLRRPLLQAKSGFIK